MNDLTPETIAELRRLAEAATPGPWRTEYLMGAGNDLLTAIIAGRATPDDLRVIGSTLAERDGKFVAAASPAVVLALLDERDALAAKVERVRALHRPVGIYDECECSDEAKTEGHEDVEEVGLTCNRMYTVCAECCRDDVYQTEDCANYHDHKPDEAHHCPTIRALDGGAES